MARGGRGAPDSRHDVARVMAFVNTLSGRGSGTPTEALVSYDALVDWARAAGVVGAQAAADLRREAGARPHDGTRALEQARDLRETLHALFQAVSQHRTPGPALLATLADYLGGGYLHARLVYQDGTLQWAPGSTRGLENISRELARAAARLVGSSQLAQVRACAADDCRWWFVDDTRNHSRRWCEMKTCGNRAKLRRYRAARRD